MEIRTKIRIARQVVPASSYPWRWCVQVLKSRDGGKTYNVEGMGKFTKTRDEARQLARILKEGA